MSHDVSYDRLSLQPWAETTGGGDRGTIPQLSGWGIKYLISPNIFTVQKVIFNAFSVLGCFYKKFQQILGDVEKKFFDANAPNIVPPNFRDKSPPLVAAVHIHDIS
jgi:hypothetical protein